MISGIDARRRAASTAALAALLLSAAACQKAEPVATPAASSPAAPVGAAAASRVGDAGSDCVMPVSFGIVEAWKPKAVTVGADDALAELARRGPLTMVCEIDAKPAGNIGFLRVWTGAAGDPRATLTAFIGTNAVAPAFTELQIGGKPALEVVYRQKSELDDSMEEERAFAVPTGAGVAAVSLDSFDNEEHAAMLPAYELAKSSLTVTG